MRSKIRGSQLDGDVFEQSTAESIAAFYLLGPVFQTGDQGIFGLKTFYTTPQISGGDFVVCVGGQYISGPKYFTTPIFGDQINSLTGNSYILVNSGRLYDRNGLISLDWNNHQFTGNAWHFQVQPTLSGAEFVLTTGGQFIGGTKTFTTTLFTDSIGNTSTPIQLIDLGNQKIFDSAGIASIDWLNRQLYPVLLGAPTLDYNNLQLSGNWLTNTVPTLPQHIANKNYVDGRVSGAVISNVVYTTGFQTIGVKDFSSGALFGDGVIGDNNDFAEFYLWDTSSSVGINIGSGRLYDDLDNITSSVSLDWVNHQLSGLLPWTAQKFQISSSGNPISCFNSGRAILTTGAAFVSFIGMQTSSNILLTSQIDGGTPGWLRIVNRQNGIGFAIQSSSATDLSTIYWEAKL